METLTTKTEITNEFEEVSMYFASDDTTDTPRPGDGDEPVEPVVPKPVKPKDDDEVIKPGGF